jgi:hypothetical protein
VISRLSLSGSAIVTGGATTDHGIVVDPENLIPMLARVTGLAIVTCFDVRQRQCL